MSIYLSFRRIVSTLCLIIAVVYAEINHRQLQTIPRSCDYLCKQGACYYESCRGVEGPKCPGGGCEFKYCDNPSCEGGGCVFHRCKRATCKGGGCHFYYPDDILEHGYCDGEGCYLEGNPHPVFSDYLAL